MANKVTVLVFIGMLLGVLGTWYATTKIVNNNMTVLMGVLGMHPEAATFDGVSMNLTVEEILRSLQEKKDEEFDQAFVESMISQHKGTIEMARQAEDRAQHYELKRMAEDIIAANTEEMNQLREWQEIWGYEKGI